MSEVLTGVVGQGLSIYESLRKSVAVPLPHRATAPSANGTVDVAASESADWTK